MGQKEIIEKTKALVTKDSLLRDFQRLGLQKGMTVIVHSSLSALGYVCGGPVAVVQALMETIGEEGNLVMPTQSADLSDPATWENPPVPEHWHQAMRDAMPAYDPVITPTFYMGAIVEVFRNTPGVIRSSHPTDSFAAWGKMKEKILGDQPLDFGLGEASPLAKLYNIGAHVLLIGVGYDNNTSMHLAEHRVPGREPYEKGSPIYENGKRVWKVYQDIPYEDEFFDTIGRDFENEYPNEVTIDKVGHAKARLINQRSLIDYTEAWFKKNS